MIIFKNKRERIMYKFIDLIEKYDLNHTILLRFALFVLLIMHSVPGMFDGGVNIFGS
jgi:putative oxidoreductase